MVPIRSTHGGGLIASKDFCKVFRLQIYVQIQPKSAPFRKPSEH